MKRVLYSPGFGAGIGSEWISTPRCDDPVLVELYDLGATQAEVEQAFPDEYWSGWVNVTHRDVPEGSWWRIHEYDGSESIIVVTSLEEAGFVQA
jgi:hypothetical protein